MTSKCIFCYGYGFWPIGRLCPIGKGDASEWNGKTIKCPSCGAGDIAEGERYDAVKKFIEEHKK